MIGSCTVIVGGNKNGAKVFTKGVGLGNQLFAAAGLALLLPRVAVPAGGVPSAVVNNVSHAELQAGRAGGGCVRGVGGGGG